VFGQNVTEHNPAPSPSGHPLLSGPPTLNDIHHHGMRSSPLGAETVCKSTRNSFADALFTRGLMALMQPIICCVKAQSAREFVTEFSGGVTPRTEAVWLRATVEL
jgi:hypothetical protein